MSEKGGASVKKGWHQSQRRVAPVTEKGGASDREGWRQ